MDSHQQQAFEAAIDANPLDATTHLAYADALDESGHDPHEAKFRRAMGEWLNKSPQVNFEHEMPPVEDHNPLTWPWVHLGSWANGSRPEGVGRFPMYWHDDDPAAEAIDPDAPPGKRIIPRQPHHAAWIPYENDGVDGIGPGSYNPGDAIGGRFAWKTYRDMEQSFRESFMRNQVDPKRMSRIARAYKKSRRVGA